MRHLVTTYYGLYCKKPAAATRRDTEKRHTGESGEAGVRTVQEGGPSLNRYIEKVILQGAFQTATDIQREQQQHADKQRDAVPAITRPKNAAEGARQA